MLAYNTAHRALNSKVETVVQDFMEADPAKVGNLTWSFFSVSFITSRIRSRGASMWQR
jgi:hypothetical protein